MPDTGESPAPEPADKPQDDVKARFREALDRKNARHADGEGADGKDTSKVHGGAHGPAHQQRTFRRKSG